MINALKEEAKSKNAAFIKLEPNVVLASEKAEKDIADNFKKLGLIPSNKSLFTKWNFLIDLTHSEDGLLAAMQPKTRYNIKIAQRYGVEVRESTDEIDFDIYLKLYFETTKRQKYFGHTREYHKLVWETLMPAGMARVLTARYRGKPLVAWMLLNFKDTLYYPYGGSSEQYKNLFGSSLVAWESIKLGKSLGCKSFDMWGTSVDPNDTADSYYGFTNFKLRFGGKHVVYIDSYDLVLNEHIYSMFNSANNLRWKLLKILK